MFFQYCRILRCSEELERNLSCLNCNEGKNNRTHQRSDFFYSNDAIHLNESIENISFFCTFRKHTFSYKNKHLYFSDEFFGRNLFRLGILLLLQLLLLLLLHQLLLVLKLQLLLLQHFLFRCGSSGLGKELLLLTKKLLFWNTLKYRNRLC